MSSFLTLPYCQTYSYSQKCHTTYTTDFVPEQEEKCEENFKKNCFIEYREVDDASLHTCLT